MKKLKKLTVSVLILVVLMLACYSLLSHNISNYSTLSKEKFYAVDEILYPPPKIPPRITG